VTNLPEALARALEHLQARRIEEAEAIYRQILRQYPDNADSWHFLGVSAYNQGKHPRALELIARALELEKSSAVYHANLALVQSALGMPDEAIESCKRALALHPGIPSVLNDLGNLYFGRGEFAEAASSYRQAIAGNDAYAEAHHNLGLALHALGDADGATDAFKRAVAIRPDYGDALSSLGIVHQERGDIDAAVDCHERALALDPRSIVARWRLASARLRVVYRDSAEVERSRSSYREDLLALRALCDEDPLLLPDLAPALGSAQPFYLPYQGRDDREIQALYGGLVVRGMSASYPQWSTTPARPWRPGEPIRVGFVSGYFRTHSNWKIPIRGWVENLDRRRFQLFGYHTGGNRDAVTDQASRAFDRFVQGPLPLERWVEEIARDAPHVLIQPGIGMDGMSVQLAGLRLAPVQCTSWGHPTTSGIPTIDYFLSSDLMEPAAADRFYTESLVRLPNLSIYYDAGYAPAVARQGDAVPARALLGVPVDRIMFWCCQSLYKYLPEYDDVFPRIGALARTARFVFIENANPHVTELFRQRLERAFARRGLSAAEFVRFAPRLDQAQFAALCGEADIFLDSIGWSGCNSTFEALAASVPVVTLAGALMRGRHSSAILAMAGVTDTTAATVDEFIAIAARLAQDEAWRSEVRKQLAAGKARIYGDLAPVRALENFIERCVGERCSASLGS
jgi:protein O-GlcNAc transferase